MYGVKNAALNHMRIVYELVDIIDRCRSHLGLCEGLESLLAGLCGDPAPHGSIDLRAMLDA